MPQRVRDTLYKQRRVALRPRLHLRDRLRQQFIQFGAKLRLGNSYALNSRRSDWRATGVGPLISPAGRAGALGRKTGSTFLAQTFGSAHVSAYAMEAAHVRSKARPAVSQRPQPG